MTPDCPWSAWTPATVRFCEADVCGWIVHPANTWSNLAYFVLGFIVLRLAVREHRPWLATIGVIEIMVGVGSFFFHASGTFVGEVVDLGAMFLFSSFVIVTNVSRLVPTWSPRSRRMSLLLLVSASITAMVLLEGGGVPLFVGHVIVAGVLEIRIYRKRNEGISYRPLILLCATFGVAWSVWWLDILGVVCDPANHLLQGHAAWHVTNALCFYFLYRFYGQLEPSVSLTA